MINKIPLGLAAALAIACAAGTQAPVEVPVVTAAIEEEIFDGRVASKMYLPEQTVTKKVADEPGGTVTYTIRPEEWVVFIDVNDEVHPFKVDQGEFDLAFDGEPVRVTFKRGQLAPYAYERRQPD